MPAIRKNGQKPERVCNQCGRKFNKTEHLERHVRSHTQDKPFVCDVCNKAFSRNDTLLRHWRQHNVAGNPPNATAAAGRRASTQVPPQPAQRGRPPQDLPGRGVMTLQFDSFNGYPHEIQGYSGQADHAPDRHTEAASVLMTLPQLQQSHPQYSSNPQDASPDAQQSYPDSSTQYRLPSQGPSPAALQSYSEDALDPMLSMTSGNGQLPTNMQSAMDPMLATENDTTQSSNNILQANHEQNQYDEIESQWDLSQVLKQAFHTTADVPTDFEDFKTAFQIMIQSWKVPKELDLSPFHALLDALMAGPLTPIDSANGTKVEYQNIEVATTSSTMEGIRELWYNYVNADDKNWLTKEIKPKSTLVDAQSINACVDAYFQHFNTTFPLVHLGTFRSYPEAPRLTLVICTVGSLLTARRIESAQFTKTFHRLAEQFDENWETIQSEGHEVLRDLFIPALILQIFGIMSGNSRNLLLVEELFKKLVSRAPVSEEDYPVYYNRPKWTADKGPQSMSAPLPVGRDLDYIWKVWADREEMMRYGRGLQILDAELGDLFQRTPLMPVERSTQMQMAPDDLFLAPTSELWLRLIQTKYPELLPSASADISELPSLYYPQPVNRFSTYAMLEGIGAQIREARHDGTMNNDKMAQTTQQLIDFYNQHCQAPIAEDPHSLIALWHATFINLYSNYHQLEVALGRDGTAAAESTQWQVSQWASSMDARRCLMHAMLMVDQVKTLRLGAEPALHVPRSLYLAAITSFSSVKFLQEGIYDGIDGLNFPEIETLSASHGGRVFRQKRIDGYDVHDEATKLLQRVGASELARKFAALSVAFPALA